MMVVYAEDRLESSGLSHFLLDLSNVFHIPPWHQYCVSRLFPPYQGLNTYICGFSQGQEGLIWAQGLQGTTANVQDRLGPGRVWPLWREFIMVAKIGFQLPLPAAPTRQQQGTPVPGKPGGLAAQCHTSCPELGSSVTGSGHTFRGRGRVSDW